MSFVDIEQVVNRGHSIANLTEMDEVLSCYSIFSTSSSDHNSQIASNEEEI